MFFFLFFLARPAWTFHGLRDQLFWWFWSGSGWSPKTQLGDLNARVCFFILCILTSNPWKIVKVANRLSLESLNVDIFLKPILQFIHRSVSLGPSHQCRRRTAPGIAGRDSVKVKLWRESESLEAILTGKRVKHFRTPPIGLLLG